MVCILVSSNHISESDGRVHLCPGDLPSEDGYDPQAKDKADLAASDIKHSEQEGAKALGDELAHRVFDLLPDGHLGFHITS